MKVYQVIIQYLEPVDAAVTLYANSEEEAVNLIRKQWAENNIEVKIIGVEELEDIPTIDAHDISNDRKIN